MDLSNYPKKLLIEKGEEETSRLYIKRELYKKVEYHEVHRIYLLVFRLRLDLIENPLLTTYYV